MASLSKSADGLYTVQFFDPSGKRKSVRLGRANKKTAETIRGFIESLAVARRNGVQPGTDVINWLMTIGDRLAKRLSHVGLVEPRARQADATIKGFIDAFIDSKRKHLQPNSITNLGQTQKKLMVGLGESTRMASVTSHRAEQWASDLRAVHSQATAARHIKFARQFWKEAVKLGVVQSNPFSEVEAGKMSNPDRNRFVTREEIDRVIEVCPSAPWRLLVVLARYGGLRIPSEIVDLTWADVSWEPGNERITIRSSKTAGSAGRSTRQIPIFPEIMLHLQDAFELAGDGAVKVVDIPCKPGTNLGTTLARWIRKAGMEPWPRIFHNLRASRQTELAAQYPLHVITSWLGNSAEIAAKHYLMVSESDYQKAVQKTGHGLRKELENERKFTSETSGEFDEPAKSPVIIASTDGTEYSPQEPNLRHIRRVNRGDEMFGGAESEAPNAALFRDLVVRWHSLTANQLNAIRNILNNSDNLLG